MYLSAQVGEKAGLAVKAAGKSVFAESDSAVQKAQNRAVGREETETRLRKCGSTQFYAGDIETDIGDDIFLSAAEINSLRRKALSALEKKIAEREEIPFYPQQTAIKRRRSKNRGYVIRLKSVSQLPSDLSLVRRVILPLDIDAKTVDSLKEKKIQPGGRDSRRCFRRRLGGLQRHCQRAQKRRFSRRGLLSRRRGHSKKSGHEALRSARDKYIQHLFARRIRATRLHRRGAEHGVKAHPMRRARRTSPARSVRLRRLPLMQTRNCPVKNGTTWRPMP